MKTQSLIFSIFFYVLGGGFCLIAMEEGDFYTVPRTRLTFGDILKENIRSLNDELFQIVEKAHQLLQTDRDEKWRRRTNRRLRRRLKKNLNQGGQINTRYARYECDGDTPLHCAAARGLNYVAKFFIQRGAPVNAQNNKEETPLHQAVNNRHRAMASLLIRSGADSTLENSSRHSPLIIAIQNLGFWKSVFGGLPDPEI